MKHLKTFNELNNHLLKEMESFGVYRNDIDKDGYITVYHGGKELPEKIRKDEIFFLTPWEDEAKDYAKMRGGRVFTLKVKPEHLNWNTGSYELEYTLGGSIVDGYITPPRKEKRFKKITKKSFNIDDEWTNGDNYRSLEKYKGFKIGDIMPKTKWEILDIIQYKNGQIQFLFDKGYYDANQVLDYELS